MHRLYSLTASLFPYEVTMSFQTIFFDKASGQIVQVLQNRYIHSKAERLRLCPGHARDAIGILYFNAGIEIDPASHHVKSMGSTHPPVVSVSSGIPLIYADRRIPFLDLKSRYKTIIVNMDGGLGDNLFRAATVMEARKQYPEHKFYCGVYDQEFDVMSLCPDIDIIKIPWGAMKPPDDYLRAVGLDPDHCGHIILNGGLLWDPRGGGFSKSALYGLFLDLGYVAYNTRLVLPSGFTDSFTDFACSIGIRDDAPNYVFQLRTKDTDDRSWSKENIVTLAAMIKESYDCNIFYLGDPIDMPDDARDMINLCGKTTWLQSIYILLRAAKVFCVDSAVLHLCRGLRIPYYCLWGHTDPWRTLGVAPGPQDIGTGFGTPASLMRSISPLQVFNRAFR